MSASRSRSARAAASSSIAAAASVRRAGRGGEEVGLRVAGGVELVEPREIALGAADGLAGHAGELRHLQPVAPVGGALGDRVQEDDAVARARPRRSGRWRSPRSPRAARSARSSGWRTARGCGSSRRAGARSPRRAPARRRSTCRGRSRRSAPGSARVARCRIAAASVISTMNVERPPARSSAAPMRVWIASIGPSVARGGGHERAAVREQRDHRRLPHVGRLAAHVGAGDDQQPALGREPRSLGMNVSTCASTTGWRPPRIAMPASATNVGRASESAGAARRTSTARRARRAPRRRPAARESRAASSREQRLVEQLLAGERALLRRERLVLEGLQLRRDVALGVLQRLPPPVVVGHLARPARCVTSM